MKTTHPFRLITLLIAIAFCLPAATALAQPGPGDSDGPPWGEGPPPWAGEPGPPPWAGEPGPPPHAGGDDDDEEEDEGGDDDAVPDFCTGGPQPGGPDGQAGMSSIAHLDFSQQDPDTGEPIEDGAFGRMMYRWMAPLFDFVFNAHQLPPDGEYTLTYQPQPLGETTGVICLATGIVNEEGDLHLEDAFEIDTDLPADYDENEEEAVLALVVTADVNCEDGTMTNWLPADYLFGDEGMFYVDSDLEEEEEEEGED